MVMAEKGENKILVIIMICIMLILIGLSGCIGDDEKYSKYEYYLEFNPNGVGKYILVVPIANNFKKNSTEITKIIINNMKLIEGNCSYSLNYSKHGIDDIGLKIEGSSKIILQSKNNKLKEYLGLELSMHNYTNRSHFYKEPNEHWLYFNSSYILNGSISIRVNDESGKSGGGGRIETSPKFQIIKNIGWQKIFTNYNGWDT